jgi:hypothetical protein
MTEARMIQKTDKRHGIECFAVEYEVNGRTMRTCWTTIREEACVWGRIIRQHGYCMSAGGYPI